MSGRAASEAQKHRRVVWLGLGLAIFLDTLVQLVWKGMVMRLPAGEGWVALTWPLLTQPLFWVLLLLLVTQFFTWMMVLARADVSYAQPVMALSYILVAVLSAIYLGEHISLVRGVALALILAAVWLIGSTPVQTVDARTPQLSPSALPGGSHEP